MSQVLAYCNFEGAKYLFFGPNVAPLVYYSHLPIAIISLLFAYFIIKEDRKKLPNIVLFITILIFAFWVLLDSVFWASNRSDVIMFVWSVIILIEPLVFIGILHLLYMLVEKKDVPFGQKLFFSLVYSPLVFIVPMGLALSNFDLGTCLATETYLSYYTYFIEALTIVWLLGFSIDKYVLAKDSKTKKEIIYLTLGTTLFLFAFSWGNIIGSFTDDWALGQYGLFGMPIFISFLVYNIITFKTFNIKLIGTQAFVIAQGIIIGSLLFIRDINYIYIVISISLILYLILGIMIIRGVKREVALRESLEIANEQQTTLIHFISHQIKGFLAKSRNLFSLFLEGDYGPLPEYLRQPSQDGLDSGTKGVETVMEILNAANLKKGTVTYKSEKIDVRKILEPIINDQKKIAEAKGLKFETHITDSESFEMVGDSGYITHALKNLVDNSIKYTLKGGIDVNLVKKYGKILFSVKDTGVGIDPEDVPQLFTEGVRGKDSIKVNVDSTGYGLYIVKKIVEGHKGRVWFESEGVGKGTTFFIELPSA